VDREKFTDNSLPGSCADPHGTNHADDFAPWIYYCPPPTVPRVYRSIGDLMDQVQKIQDILDERRGYSSVSPSGLRGRFFPRLSRATKMSRMAEMAWSGANARNGTPGP
jgi:hypothetical protein